MQENKIITIMKISDFNLELLPKEKRNLKGDELIASIIDFLNNDMRRLPGKAEIYVNDGMIITEYDPNEFNDKDERKFRQAINLLTERDFNRGEALLVELIEDNPLNASLLYNLGMCYSEQGDFDRSIKPLEKAVEIFPYYSDAYTALGYSYKGKGDLDKAIEYTTKAIELNEDNFYALRNLASLHAEKDNYQLSKSFIDRAIELKPDEPSALYGAALIYKALGENGKAKEQLNLIIENGIDDRFIQYARKLLTEITSSDFKKDDLRMDAVMYLVAAINDYNKLDNEEIQNVAFEVGLKGRNGFKVGEPDIKYRIDALNKECTGLQMICYMYAGFQIIDPQLDIGFDLAKEYKEAKKMSESGI